MLCNRIVQILNPAFVDMLCYIHVGMYSMTESRRYYPDLIAKRISEPMTDHTDMPNLRPAIPNTDECLHALNSKLGGGKRSCLPTRFWQLCEQKS